MFSTLEGKLGSKLVVPGDTLYDELRKVWNGAIDRSPAAIAVCESEGDVVSAVAFANEKRMPISIRGGGHHVAGLAVCDDGLMIDLSDMRKVEVDPEQKVATVQGGATLADIDKETQKFGLATPTGTVSETGVAGLALSGGLGYLRGKHGLTCDNLVGVRVVTASGEAIEVNEQHYPDLFWAIRGGGGNFGVVTEFQFRLHEVGPEVLAVDVMYDYGHAKEILTKAQEYLDHAPDEVSFNLTAATLPPEPFLPEALHHKQVIMVSGMYAGDPQEGKKVIQPLRELAEPIIDQTGVIPYVELQSKLDVMVPDEVDVYGTSLYFSKLDEKTVDLFLEKLENAPTPTVLAQLWALGGQMNRVPEEETAIAIRDAQFVMLIDVMDMGVGGDVCKRWVDSVYDGLLPYSHKKSSYLKRTVPALPLV